MKPLRRWRSLLKYSVVLCGLYFLCKVLMDYRQGRSGGNLDNEEFPDHWGDDQADKAWLSEVKRQDESHLPVVVVEEHYEVLKYWYQAADLNLLPRSKNILIHIDAHVDGAVPSEPDIVPWFRYPRGDKEIHTMMQRNDVFITAAVLTGFIDHVVWVWPMWDEVGHDGEDWNYHKIDVRLGYYNLKTESQQSKDLCACWKNRQHQSHWECHRQNLNESDITDGPEIDIEDCKIQSDGVLEVMSERMAAQRFKTQDFSSKSILLDIDLDFFGCFSDVVPLYDSKLTQKQIDTISEIVSQLFCATDSKFEVLADNIYRSVISVVIKLKAKSCDESKKYLNERSKCLRLVEINNFIIDQLSFLISFLYENFPKSLCYEEENTTGLLLQTLFELLLSFSNEQLKLLSSLGICLNLSPASFYFQFDPLLHVCHGDNIPDRTKVLFHKQTEPEISLQNKNLRNILQSISKKPELITVCRSVRDGYTPKDQWKLIENSLLGTLTSTYKSTNLNLVHYDRNLLGGKAGWKGRSHSHAKIFYEAMSLHQIVDA